MHTGVALQHDGEAEGLRAMRRLIAVLAVSCSIAAVPGAAQATTVACGDTITADTTLTADLHCSSTTALNVRGDVTLDLNGHTIYGTNEFGSGIFGSMGTFTISNGTIRGFIAGVEIGKGSFATVSRVTAIDNGVGFVVLHSTAYFDRDVATRNRGDGFNVVEESGSFAAATFLRNRADWNGELGIDTNNGTDAGNNHAHKNGDPRQCVGVVCQP
jgi:hypothetical protein